MDGMIVLYQGHPMKVNRETNIKSSLSIYLSISTDKHNFYLHFLGGGGTMCTPWNSWRLHVHLLCVKPMSCTIYKLAYTFVNIASIHVLWLTSEQPVMNVLSIHDAWLIYKWLFINFPKILVVWIICEWPFINVLSIHIRWMFYEWVFVKWQMVLYQCKFSCNCA